MCSVFYPSYKSLNVLLYNRLFFKYTLITNITCLSFQLLVQTAQVTLWYVAMLQTPNVLIPKCVIVNPDSKGTTVTENAVGYLLPFKTIHYHLKWFHVVFVCLNIQIISLRLKSSLLEHLLNPQLYMSICTKWKISCDEFCVTCFYLKL